MMTIDEMYEIAQRTMVEKIIQEYAEDYRATLKRHFCPEKARESGESNAELLSVLTLVVEALQDVHREAQVLRDQYADIVEQERFNDDADLDNVEPINVSMIFTRDEGGADGQAVEF